MKHGVLVPFLGSIAALVSLAGCPFESELPLGEPVPGSLDPLLVGAWTGIEGDEGDTLRIVIYPFNDAEYYIETVGEGDDVDRYRAYIVPAGDRKLLQVNEVSVEPATGGYIFARYDAGPGPSIRIRLVGETAVPEALAADPVGLRAFLSDHWSDPALDDADGVLELRRAED